MSEVVLQVRNLQVQYDTGRGPVNAVNNVSFDLHKGEILGLVGESGSGKTTMGMALVGLIRSPGRVAGGEILLNGRNLAGLSEEAYKKVRLADIALMPQGAMNSLNPVMRIKDQIIDGMLDHNLGLSRSVLEERAHDALEVVELDRKVGRMYPHELSGGMKQRACIAISVAMHPKVIIADEPTSALDVVTQRQVMQTIGRLQEQLGSAVILIGHDMGLMAQFAHRMAVMYAGSLVELGSIRDIYTDALHPYTQMLIDSLPTIGKRGIFKGIPGITPLLRDLPPGCVFNTRCPKVMDVCRAKTPVYREYKAGHWAACHLHEDGVVNR